MLNAAIGRSFGGGGGGGGLVVNVGLTQRTPAMVSWHGPVPVQDPDQPTNSEAWSAVAVRVTEVPVGKLASHVVPQSIPDGLEDTVPLPGPSLEMVRCWTSGPK